MKIRKVTFEEMKDVMAIIDEFDRPKKPWPSDEKIGLIFHTLQENGGCVLGAFQDEKLVGTCTLNVCQNFSWSGRPFAMIENVIVSKQHRNGGAGKALLLYAKKLAQAADCYKVALMTGSKKESTLNFYESAGFLGNKTGFQIRFDT